MSETTAIEWCDSTWSAWIGCTKVSTEAAGGGACDNCYAEALNKRFNGGQNWGPGAPRRRTSDTNWRMPLSWNRNANSFRLEHGRNRRVFLNNQADIFDNEVSDDLRGEVFDLIEATPHLDWLLLTKRIGNAKRMLPARWLEPGGWPKHVRLGITLCNKPETDRDLPKLLALPCPNFVSLEPLLGPIDLTGEYFTAKLGRYPFPSLPREHRTRLVDMLDWVIAGGESGPKARPAHPDWFRSLRDQCASAGVPFLFKQHGEWLPAKEGRSITGKVIVLEGAAPFSNNPPWHCFEDGQQTARIGKKAAGRLLDGVEHNGFPEVPCAT